MNHRFISLLAVLKQLATHWQVDQMPDNPSTYHLNHPVGAVFLQYGGAKYQQPIGTDVCQQERVQEYGILIVGRRQFNTSAGPVTGVVDMLDVLIDALPGQRIDGTRPIRLVRDEFVGEQAGIWSYRLVIGIESVVSHQLIEPEF